MPPNSSAIKAYLIPYGAYAAVMIVAGCLPQSARHWLYPAQTLLCGALIIGFWPVYRLSFPKRTVFTLLIAILVLFIWISPQMLFRQPPRFTGFDPTIFKDRPALYWTDVTARFIRLAVVVPCMEEVFWRGFLLRYLVREDFESVPPNTFTWFSFGVVSAGFSLEHTRPDWPAALLTGALFNLVYYRTRSLSSCILAHAVANFLLGIYIMRTGQWGFW